MAIKPAIHLLFLSSLLASAMAADAPLWGGAQRSGVEGEIFSCRAGEECRWALSGAMPRLDTLSALDLDLQLLQGDLLDLSGLELVAVWERGAVGFDLLIPGGAQRLSLLPVWSEGEEVDWSVAPQSVELHWIGEAGSSAELLLKRWNWRAKLPDPDEIGKMGPYPAMIEAINALKEGVMPPYSGVRGERVEKARRLHMRLWSAEKKFTSAETYSLWVEGRRWMAQAWVINGATSLPRPKEVRAFLIQQQDRSFPGMADSLARAGATLLLDEGWNLFDSSATFTSSLQEDAKRLGLQSVPAVRWGLLPEEIDSLQALQFDSLGWLQRDPNGVPLPALSNCSEDGVSHLLRQLNRLLEESGSEAVALEDLGLPFGVQADYHPNCRTLFESWLRQKVEAEGNWREAMKGWPGAVFPDSSLYAPFLEFQRERLDSTVLKISSLLKERGVEFWLVVDEEASRRAEELKSERWAHWSRHGAIDLLIPKIFESDLGRFRVRLKRWSAELKAIALSRGGKAVRSLPMITLWETASWKERQELARQLEQIGELRSQKAGEGIAFYTANAAWLRHDAAWVARGALCPALPEKKKR